MYFWSFKLVWFFVKMKRLKEIMTFLGNFLRTNFFLMFHLNTQLQISQGFKNGVLDFQSELWSWFFGFFLWRLFWLLFKTKIGQIFWSPWVPFQTLEFPNSHANLKQSQFATKTLVSLNNNTFLIFQVSVIFCKDEAA